MSYEAFIAGKRLVVPPVGFEPGPIGAPLFPFQKANVEWAIRRGRAAMFLDTGLGKTIQQLEWARQVANHTGRRVLILAPLAVSHQTVREAARFGLPAAYAPGGTETPGPVLVTNYERLSRFDEDEKHMCPLQLDLIERVVRLYSNPGDTVFSPFAGIGSEGYVSLKAGRKFVGVELKPEYFEWAARNLRGARSQLGLFEMARPPQPLTAAAAESMAPEPKRLQIILEAGDGK